MGIGENLKGTVKEKAGELTDNRSLEAEGQAQRSKGSEQTHESADRAEAKTHEKRADALAREQDAIEN